LAQKKAAQMARYGIELDQQKVNIFTGLNILSILLHFSASIKNSNTSSESIKSSLIFFPCGYPKEIDHDPQRLLKIIGYSHCISTTTFVQVVGKFLSHANLQEVDLNGVDLHGADLHGADLHGADLHGADLYKAELSRTNMRGANLQGAKMQEALFRGAFLSRADLSKSDLRNSNLRRAYLNRANLQDTNLECADLMGAYLYSVELSGADLRNIPWNSHTKWANAIGLHEINGVPESLSKDSNFRASVQLSHGYSCACQQKIKEAIALYKEAQEIDPNIKVSARFWNKLCWIGVLNKCAKEVLFAGVNATNLEPKSANYRDTLAAAKFMDGDINGAIEDFQEAIRLGFKNPEDEERRKLWLDQLRNGNNPFTQEEIDNLRSLEIPEKEDSESELY
jgi:uncharacterized protein YjbI with pentapeptide repeats